MDHLKTLFRYIVPKKYRAFVRSIIFPLLYYGKNVSCPCCNGNFRRFLPFDVKGKVRQNAVCPKCSSFERHRFFWLYLINRTNIEKDKLKILHFAPEYIFQKHFKAMGNLDYVSADLDSPNAMVHFDITRIPYSDNSFDVILCTDVLEHVIDDRRAMREMYRILKKGGWAMIQAPIDRSKKETFEDTSVVSPEDRQRVFGHYEHVRIYGADYKNRLEDAGFMVRVDAYSEQLSTQIKQKYGIKGDREIYYCSK